jgi:hypothetical protein
LIHWATITNKLIHVLPHILISRSVSFSISDLIDKNEAMEDLNATDEVKSKEAEEGVQVHDAQTMEGLNATHEVKGIEAEEQAQVPDDHAMEIISENQHKQYHQTETEAKSEGKGKGEEKLVEDETPFGGVSEGQAEDSGVNAGGLWDHGQAGAQVHGPTNSEDEIPAPSNEIALPSVPPSQDQGSETVSIIASSVSNPTLEVDTQVLRFNSWVWEKKANGVKIDDESDADSAITDLRQQ